MIKGREISDKRLYVHSLDGLRGIAVLAVFLSHTALAGYRPAPFLYFDGTGKSGVFLFFILSSFLLTYPFLLKEKKAFEKDALINFTVRRFFRIYPLFVAYLFFAFGSSLLVGNILGKAETGIPFYLTFPELLNHVFLQNGKGVTWSILVEFRYYFILPLIGYLFAILLKGRLFLSLLTIVVLMGIGQIFYPQAEALTNDPRLLPYLPVMLTGTALAILQYHWKDWDWDKDKSKQRIVEAIGWIAIGFCILSVPSVYYSLVERSHECSALVGTVDFAKEECHKVFHHSFIQQTLLWGTVVFAAVNGNSWIRKIGEWMPLRYLGWISFSFYLFHPIFIQVWNNVPFELPSYLVFWLILGTTIFVSHYSYRWIELPSSKIKYKANKKKETSGS